MLEAPSTGLRVGRWLWCVRVPKTRSLASEACRAGLVLVAGLPAKPSRAVRIGETVVVKVGELTRSLEVVGLPASRVGAKELPRFLVDRTPPEEIERARRAKDDLLAPRD